MDLNLPWVTKGDFNSITSSDESSSNSRNGNIQSINLMDWIFGEGLIDLGFMGHVFTWTWNCFINGQKAAQLDRALCNSS